MAAPEFFPLLPLKATASYAGETDQDLKFNAVRGWSEPEFGTDAPLFPCQGDTVMVVGQDPQTGWWVGTVDKEKFGLVPINFLDTTADRLRAVGSGASAGDEELSLAGRTASGEDTPTMSTEAKAALPPSPTKRLEGVPTDSDL